jgi:hypothetical protein
MPPAFPLTSFLLLLTVSHAIRQQETKAPPPALQEVGVFQMTIINGSQPAVTYFANDAALGVKELLRQLAEGEAEQFRVQGYAKEAQRDGSLEEQAAWDKEVAAWRKELDALRHEIAARQKGEDATAAAKEREAATRERRELEKNRAQGRDAGAAAQEQRVRAEQTRRLQEAARHRALLEAARSAPLCETPIPEPMYGPPIDQPYFHSLRKDKADEIIGGHGTNAPLRLVPHGTHGGRGR